MTNIFLGGNYSINSELHSIAEKEWHIFTEVVIPNPNNSGYSWGEGGIEEDYSVEYFASVFAIYMSGDEGYNYLKYNTPLTFAYLDKTIKKFNVDEKGNITF